VARQRHQELTSDLDRCPTRQELHNDLSDPEGEVGFSRSEADDSIDAADFSPEELPETIPVAPPPTDNDFEEEEMAKKGKRTDRKKILLTAVKVLGADLTLNASELLKEMQKEVSESVAQSILVYYRGAGNLLTSPSRGRVKLSQKGKTEMAKFEGKKPPKGAGKDEDAERRKHNADYLKDSFKEGYIKPGISCDDLASYIAKENKMSKGEAFGTVIKDGIDAGTIVNVDGRYYLKGTDPAPDSPEGDAEIEEAFSELLSRIRKAMTTKEAEVIRLEDEEKKLEQLIASANAEIKSLKEQEKAVEDAKR